MLASAVFGSGCASTARPASSAISARSPAPGTMTEEGMSLLKSEPLFGQDKVRHFFMAGFVESMAFGGLRAAGAERNAAMAGALGVTAAVALGREVYDRRTKGNFSVPDLVWDTLGASAALLILSRTQD